MDKQTVTDAVSTALAAGAVMLQILLAALAAVALAALVSGRGRRMLAAVRVSLDGSELWLAWGLALVATLGSLYFSEVAGFVPCRLCWFQRIGMYPLAVLLLVGAARSDVRGAFAYAITFPVLGALVSAYHVYIEVHPEAESGGCKVGVPCSVKWIEEFGYVTIPVLAITAFAAIAALLVLARTSATRRAAAV